MSKTPQVTIIVGGRWHSFDLARGLKARGALHRLVTSYPWFKVKPWGFTKDEVVTLPATQWLDQAVNRSMPSAWRTKFQHFIHHHFATAAARHLEGADIVHGWSSFGVPALARCRTKGVPYVVERGSSHMLAQCELLGEECRRLGLDQETAHPKVVRMELDEYAGADKVAVPSRFVERTFLQNGFPREKIIYNPLGVNLQQFRPGPGKSARGPLNVIYAGSLSFRKGIHYLVEAFRQAQLPDGRLTLVGGRVSETDRLIGTLPVGLVCPGRVAQAELVQHYHAASVFVLASIEEGMAMVQAQALATGLPLICTENTGGEDLLQIIAAGQAPIEEEGVRRYPAGFVVPIRSPEAIARCLRRLQADPALLESQAHAALRIHDFPLDWQAYADRALSSYVEILRAKSP